MPDLAIVLKTHKDECSPLIPCAHCAVVNYLRQSLKGEHLRQLRIILAETPDILFNQHYGECSPWERCRSCSAATLILQHLHPQSLVELESRLNQLDNPAPLQAETAQAETDTEHLARKLATSWKDALPDLSKRTYSCLENEQYVTLGDIVRQTEAEMLRAPNFGRKSLNELKELLMQQGLHFGWAV